MLCKAPPAFRTAAISRSISPRLSTPCAYYTTAPSLCPEAPPASPRRAPISKRHVSFSRSPNTSLISTRAASTTSHSPPSTQAPTSSTSTPTSTSSSSEVLDWNTFFRLRRTRRFFQLGSSIGTGAGGFTLGASLLARSDMDALVSQIPLDPFITLGLITFTCGGVGWLVGPFLGTGVFNWRIGRSRKQQMGEKEVEFYRRVKKYRVDPSGGSAGNPVPDYYGEKIASVAGYRQWLKDQRAFNKKRHTYI